MWIATRIGFFSLVHKEGQYHVRARSRDDLAELCQAVGWSAKWIERWPTADYRWRVRVNRSALDDLFARLPRLISYPNFKSEVAANPRQRRKLAAYERLWAALHELQWEEEGA